MPTIEQSLKSNLNLAGYSESVTVPTLGTAVPTSTSGMFLRCPVPPIGTVSWDNVQMFDRAGYCPQYRVFQKGS